jgi:ketosteroid isomerase-like protein
MKTNSHGRFLQILAFAVAAFQANSVTAAGPPTREETAVRDAEARWIDALERRDGAALQALLDDDFLDVTWKGEVRDRGAAIAALNAPGRPPMTQELRDVRVRFAVPDVAIVTGVNAVSSKAPDFTARVRFTDVFVKRGGAWKALSAQETLEKAD